jgi:hypothetical protein
VSKRLYNPDTFLSDTFSSLNEKLSGSKFESDEEAKYLSQPAPNIVEWVTGLNYWNMACTFDHYRQYQIMRDAFLLRCPICNSTRPEDIDCWGKSRNYLESENLLVWNTEHNDFVCPKCKSTQRELVYDGMFPPYNEMIILAGMRSGKSYLGAHIGGYFEHMLSAWGMKGKGSLQKMLKQAKSEWFEVTFAASTATQAQETIYAKYREMRNDSPWIKRYMTWVKAAEKRQVSGGSDKWAYKSNEDSIKDGWLQVRFNRIASDAAGIAGKTRIMGSIDEWARLINSDGTRSALELYRVLNQSLKTVRAAVNLNELPLFLGMMINVTSPIAQDDPAMLTYNAARDGETKKCYGWKGPTWEFNPFMPRSEFDEEYAKDEVGAERDFGANPPLAATPYIEDPQRFWQCIDWSRRPTVQYSYEYKTDATNMEYVSAEVSDCHVDPINKHYIFADAGVRWDSFSLVIARPKWVQMEPSLSKISSSDPNNVASVLREIRQEQEIPDGFMRVPGSSDNRGGMIAIPGSLADMQRNKDLSPLNNLDASQSDAMLVTEIVSAFRIVPEKGREIWFESIIDIIATLKQRIHIVDFGCDNWNSVSTIQAIRNMGIPAQEVTLRIDDFMAFKNLAYNNRISMLPPDESDHLKLSANGQLSIGTAQPDMSGEGIALVELLKLSRSEDLKKVFNERKGTVRGQDSDDVARCIIGANRLVQGAVVDPKAQNRTRHQTLQRLKSMENSMSGQVVRFNR